MWAAILHRTRVAKALLKCKVDISTQDHSGKTCVEISDNTFIERMLLIMGADQKSFRKNFQRRKALEMEEQTAYIPKSNLSRENREKSRLRQLSMTSAEKWIDLNDLRLKAEEYLRENEIFPETQKTPVKYYLEESYQNNFELDEEREAKLKGELNEFDNIQEEQDQRKNFPNTESVYVVDVD